MFRSLFSIYWVALLSAGSFASYADDFGKEYEAFSGFDSYDSDLNIGAESIPFQSGNGIVSANITSFRVYRPEHFGDDVGVAALELHDTDSFNIYIQKLARNDISSWEALFAPYANIEVGIRATLDESVESCPKSIRIRLDSVARSPQTRELALVTIEDTRVELKNNFSGCYYQYDIPKSTLMNGQLSAYFGRAPLRAARSQYYSMPLDISVLINNQDEIIGSVYMHVRGNRCEEVSCDHIEAAYQDLFHESGDIEISRRMHPGNMMIQP